MNSTYTCEACGGTFEGRSEEESRAEAADLFPGHEPADMAQVCDACFHGMMGDTGPSAIADPIVFAATPCFCGDINCAWHWAIAAEAHAFLARVVAEVDRYLIAWIQARAKKAAEA